MNKFHKLGLFSVILLLALASIAAGYYTFRTQMKGEYEVPVAVDTDAKGNAVFRVSADGTTIYYKLVINKIDNVFMAHIHLAPAGSNGPIVVWLYPDSPNPPNPSPPASWIEGRFNGKLADGEITAEDLVGPLAGMPLSDLISALEAGNLYVNVHTSDFIAPANTGPGDFPGGEIRGQLHDH